MKLWSPYSEKKEVCLCLCSSWRKEGLIYVHLLSSWRKEGLIFVHHLWDSKQARSLFKLVVLGHFTIQVFFRTFCIYIHNLETEKSVAGHLKIGHTFKTSYKHMPNLN